MSHPLQLYKLWELERVLAEIQPTRILEFGTGSTTPILARYVLEQPGRTLLAVDEDAAWLKHTHALLPPGSDAPAIRLEHRQKTIRTAEGVTEIRYEPTPEGLFDFILVDGPSLSGPDGQKIAGSVNTNVRDFLESPSPPATIVVDMRKDTVRWLQRTYGDRYQARVSDRIKRVRRADYRYLSILELRH